MPQTMAHERDVRVNGERIVRQAKLNQDKLSLTKCKYNVSRHKKENKQDCRQSM